MTVADAQLGVVRILRPYLGFEADYGGQSVNTPIMLTEVIKNTGGEPRDQGAIQTFPGYDPDLVRGLSVPMGARVLLYIPKMIADDDRVTSRYNWAISWRLRNTHDFNELRVPYHFPKMGNGTPDAGAARVVIPVADNTTVYSVANPLGLLDRVVQPARTEDVSFAATNLALPVVPVATSGHPQQGLLNPALVVDPDLPFAPLYEVHELFAAGDELLIGVYRDITAGATWDFTQAPPAADALLSLLLGNADGGGTSYQNVGVYVTVGSTP